MAEETEETEKRPNPRKTREGLAVSTKMSPMLA